MGGGRGAGQAQPPNSLINQVVVKTLHWAFTDYNTITECVREKADVIPPSDRRPQDCPVPQQDGGQLLVKALAGPV